MAILKPGIRYLAVTMAAVALTGCGTVNQQPKTPPTATISPTAAPASTASTASTPTAATTSATPSPAPATATASGTAGRPSIQTLQAALVVYFRDQQQLSADKAQRAAACAVYPSFQELSTRSLAAVIRHDPAGIDPGDKKVFGDVTTECVTAAG